LEDNRDNRDNRDNKNNKNNNIKINKEIELDEFYFEARRVRGKRGIVGKTIVFLEC
jgi:hypothetical protein